MPCPNAMLGTLPPLNSFAFSSPREILHPEAALVKTSVAQALLLAQRYEGPVALLPLLNPKFPIAALTPSSAHIPRASSVLCRSRLFTLTKEG